MIGQVCYGLIVLFSIFPTIVTNNTWRCAFLIFSSGKLPTTGILTVILAFIFSEFSGTLPLGLPRCECSPPGMMVNWPVLLHLHYATFGNQASCSTRVKINPPRGSITDTVSKLSIYQLLPVLFCESQESLTYLIKQVCLTPCHGHWFTCGAFWDTLGKCKLLWPGKRFWQSGQTCTVTATLQTVHCSHDSLNVFPVENLLPLQSYIVLVVSALVHSRSSFNL